MEEKKENKVNSEEIKEEATNTVNQVKDTIKKVDIKKDSAETKGFITDMFKDPLRTMQKIVDQNASKYLTYSIIIVAVWVLAKLIYKACSLSSIWGWRFSNIGSNILSILLTGIAPIVSILVMSLIVFLLNSKNKKQLTTIITVVTTASLPLAIASVVRLLGIFGTKVSTITSPFSSLCGVISTILMYFGIKSIFGTEKNSEFIKKFVLIEGIYYIAYIVLSFLEIYI